MRLMVTAAACAAALTFGACTVQAASALPKLAIDQSQTTVSGLSSGGYMAVQLHVGLSGTFRKGAGVVAGGPYYCAEGSIVNATGRCMTHSSPIPVSNLVSTTKSWASSGAIDPVSNLQSSTVYLFAGTADTTVVPAVMNDLLTYYQSFVPSNQIIYKRDMPAEHGMITDDYGNACGTKASPFINDCNFDLAGAMLQAFYGNLSPRNNGTLQGKLVEFDQTPFVSGHGMATTGWAYVPQACAAGTRCRLHVVLHGCKQNTAMVGMAYVERAGYNRWGDTNNIVMLYPQTSTSAVNSCWDWWGYDSPDYAKKSGPQMVAIKKMVDTISSGSAPSTLPPPSSVALSGATETSMVVSWSAVNGATGYNVYRNGARANNATVSGTQYTDSGLSAGTSYTWTVKSVDSNGGESLASNAVTGQTTGTAAACFTSSNYAHTSAGRAHVSRGYTYANGSNQNMGLWNMFTSTTLKRTGTNYYVIGTCQ